MNLLFHYKIYQYLNNTPHAFRKICAPWGVTFFMGVSIAIF